MPSEDDKIRESLLKAMEAFDRAFREHRPDDLAAMYAQDGRLMFPLMEDIVGRQPIAEVFTQFMSAYETESNELEREVIDICGERAYVLGRFIEVRTPRDGRPTEKVYGRIVEVWRHTDDGGWEVLHVMTGRYAETELLE